MTTRRSLLVATGSAALTGLAGCLGGSSPSPGTDADATGNNGGNSGSASGQITGVSFSNGGVSITLIDDNDVESVNLINEAGENVESALVATGSSRVTFEFVEEDMSFNADGYTSKPAGVYRFVAVNDADEQVGEADFDYNPRIEITDVTTAAEALPDEGSKQALAVEITNTGNAPAIFNKLGFAYLSDRDENNIGEADGYAGDEDGGYPSMVIIRGVGEEDWKPGDLGTQTEIEGDSIERVTLDPGETRVYTRRLFRITTDAYRWDADSIDECDFKRTFGLRAYYAAGPETPEGQLATVHLTGEFNEETETGSSDYWCSNTEVVSDTESDGTETA